MATACNVFGIPRTPQDNFAPNPNLFGRVSNIDYRAAVARTIRLIKAEHNLSNERLADALGCSEGTVSNAEKERGNLDACIMLNLAALFGGQCAIKPILALINGAPVSVPTIADRLERIEREAVALRKEIVR